MSKQPKDRHSLDFPIALGSTAICAPFQEDVKTASGIIIPETAESAVNHAIVMAVGAECKREFLDFNGQQRKLQVGDKVIHNTYANLTIIHKQHSYLVLNELDIYAVIPDGSVVTNKKILSRNKTNKK
jgi:chaperonin GroES